MGGGDEITKLQDLREKETFLAPSEGMIPEGVRNTVMNIYTLPDIIGDIEIGTDGFVQAIFEVMGCLVRLEVYPGRDQAYLRVLR